jgi:CRISPR-associated exonuclease Cas4
MIGTLPLAVVAVLGLLLGLVLLRLGQGVRHRLGLGGGKTVSLDRVTLTSRRYGLTGRPDRLVKCGGMVIIEEWKSSRSLAAWHRAQMGAYFVLAEEALKVRPSHGFVVTGDGLRHRIDNSDELRAWVLGMVEQIRRLRQTIDQPVPVHPPAWQCRPCGMRGHCRQARS